MKKIQLFLIIFTIFAGSSTIWGSSLEEACKRLEKNYKNLSIFIDDLYKGNKRMIYSLSPAEQILFTSTNETIHKRIVSKEGELLQKKAHLNALNDQLYNDVDFVKRGNLTDFLTMIETCYTLYGEIFAIKNELQDCGTLLRDKLTRSTNYPSQLSDDRGRSSSIFSKFFKKTGTGRSTQTVTTTQPRLSASIPQQKLKKSETLLQQPLSPHPSPQQAPRQNNFMEQQQLLIVTPSSSNNSNSIKAPLSLQSGESFTDTDEDSFTSDYVMPQPLVNKNFEQNEDERLYTVGPTYLNVSQRTMPVTKSQNQNISQQRIWNPDLYAVKK